MGQHYVQRHYLRCFGTPEDPNYIWMYDKSLKTFKRLPVKNVAQSRGFYSKEDERALSETVEQPAQAPLGQLRNSQPVEVQGRRAVAVYLESMIKRGPHNRNKLLAMVPQVKDELLLRIRGHRELLAGKFNLTEAELLLEIEQWEQSFDSNPLSAQDDLISRQWRTEDLIRCIFSMTWRVIKADGANRFLTSDNPVFFDEGYGLKRPDGEFSFPLSSDVALHGSWNGQREGLLIVHKEPGVVKELNRRTAFMAERFIFYHRTARWVSVVAKKQQPSLNRLWW